MTAFFGSRNCRSFLRSIVSSSSFRFLAERVGFEPTERFPAHSISSAANSTTLAPLRKDEGGRMKDEQGHLRDLIHPSSFRLHPLLSSHTAPRDHLVVFVNQLVR